MLDFRFKEGNAHALPYAYLSDILRNPTEGIGLKFTGQRNVFLRGRNLNHLRQGLLTHHIEWVREIDQSRALILLEVETVTYSVFIE